jgi:ATP-dependent Lon protease
VEEIGLFPLGIVLLPTERIPLHIFEPRYRELIEECIELDREFGLLFEDDDGLREVGTRAAVLEVIERFEDGRLNVLVEGRERFRLVSETSGRSFRTGEVEPVVDAAAEAADPEAVARAVELLEHLAELTGAELERPQPSSPAPSFELAARVELEPHLKQKLLELDSEPERLASLAVVLERAARGVRVQRERAELASRNGKLTPPRR